MNTNRNSPFQAFDRSEIGSPNSERAGDNTTLSSALLIRVHWCSFVVFLLHRYGLEVVGNLLHNP